MDAEATAALGEILDAYTPVDPEAGLVRLLGFINQQVGGVGASVLVGTRKQAERTPRGQKLLQGWRVLAQYAPDELPFRDKVSRDEAELAYYALVQKHGELDPITAGALSSPGEHRSAHTDVMCGTETFQQHWMYTDFLRPMGFSDRMTGIYSVDVDNEAFYFVDRADGEPPFTQAQADELLNILCFAGEISRHLLLEQGAVPTHAKLLSLREVKLVRALLGGSREREIAEQWELSERTLHAAVMRVYQKLAVNSRAELSARWLTPA